MKIARMSALVVLAVAASAVTGAGGMAMADATPRSTVGQVIGHDRVVGFAEVEAVTLDQRLAKRFQPYLAVKTGCVPFPVVDADGNTGGGLAPTGSSSGGCSSHTGQVYTRAGWQDGAYAIMYAWYFPKDSPSPGMGHRHDWEHILVWVDDPHGADPQIEKISYFRHGSYSHVDPSGNNTAGTRPLVAYHHTWPLNHALWETRDIGGQQPLIGWDDLSSEARSALSTVDLEAANVSIHDEAFASHLVRGDYR